MLGRREASGRNHQARLTRRRAGAYSRVAMMHRRTAIRALFGSAMVGFAVPLATEAQQAPPTARVGFITPSNRSSFESGGRRVYRDSFTGRLRELGWIEGQNLVIESRYAEGHYERLPVLAGELVRLSVDVIFANSAPAA